jgi:hypothetical protein
LADKAAFPLLLVQGDFSAADAGSAIFIAGVALPFGKIVQHGPD